MGLAGGRRAASDTVGEGGGQPVQGVGFLGLNAAGVWGRAVPGYGAVLGAAGRMEGCLTSAHSTPGPHPPPAVTTTSVPGHRHESPPAATRSLSVENHSSWVCRPLRRLHLILGSMEIH